MTTHPKRGHRRRRKPPQPKSGPRREHIEELHPSEDVPEIESFAEWDLGEEIQRGIAAMDITKPTPIQALSIGPVLEGRDVIAKAETGTGKTLAFGAPMMARIDPARSTVLGLVLCPTRELAQQVCDVLSALALPRGVRVALVVGGDPTHPQIAALQAGAQVVVGTPGRVLDLAGQRFLSFPWTEYVVLDEADKMFEIGFLDDIKKILAMTPEERQTLLFSATFPTEVLKLARNSTRDPLEVATAKGMATVSAIDQRYLKVDEPDRPMALIRLLEQSDEEDVFLVFCERRTDVDKLMRRLERLPFQVKALHGGYDQASRFRVMTAFRTGDVKALVATDVASRGLDVQHVTHVVNFGVPREVESYTHRIGRTGRAGRTGTAITMLVPADRRRWNELLRRTKFDVQPMDAPERTGRRGAGRREESRERGGEDRGRRRERSRRRDEDEREVERDEERPSRRRSEEARPARRSRRAEPEEVREPRERGGSRPQSRRGRGDEPEDPRRSRRARREEPEEPREPRTSRRGRRDEEEAPREGRRSRRVEADERSPRDETPPRRRRRRTEEPEERPSDERAEERPARPRRRRKEPEDTATERRARRPAAEKPRRRNSPEDPKGEPARPRRSSDTSSPPGFGEGI